MSGAAGDYGRKLLQKYGWTDGKGLGTNEDGRKTFVRDSAKRNRHGIGLEAKSVGDIWWERLYNSASQSMSVRAESSEASDASDNEEAGQELRKSATESAKESIQSSNEPSKETKKKKKQKQQTKQNAESDPVDIAEQPTKKDSVPEAITFARYSSIGFVKSDTILHNGQLIVQEPGETECGKDGDQDREDADSDNKGANKKNKKRKKDKKVRPDLTHVDARRLAEDADTLGAIDVLNSREADALRTCEKRAFGMHGNAKQLGKLERLALQEKSFKTISK